MPLLLPHLEYDKLGWTLFPGIWSRVETTYQLRQNQLRHRASPCSNWSSIKCLHLEGDCSLSDASNARLEARLLSEEH